MAKSLKDEITNSSLYASLYGLREVFRQEFQIEDIFFNLSEEKKDYLRRKEHTSYPYASIRLSTFKIPKNQINVKMMRQAGRTSYNDTFATIKQSFVYPFQISGEFVYVNSSIQETLLFVEHFSLVAVADRFVYKITGKDNEWFCIASIDDVSVNLTERQLSNQNDPGMFEIIQPFELSSRAGVVRETSGIQREPTYTFKMDEL